MAIRIEDFGKDHWSTFAYLETRCVDYKGVPDLQHMRCDPDRHPGMLNRANHTFPKQRFATRLRGYWLENDQKDENRLVPNHDDWDCWDDLEAAGLLENLGSGINRIAKLTMLGQRVAAQVREHKQKGGMFATFVPTL